ncbi:MAG TPA: hypothetical protein PLT32_01800 [bacterium]|nr:hypothetical protein [bacterium]
MFKWLKFWQKKTVSQANRFPLIVVGKVLEVSNHPQADRLHLTKVDVGSEILTIVCGAPNVAEGQLVAVAKIGAQLAPDFVIAPVSLRGEMSYGMLCSAKELGLGEDHDGIMVLDENRGILPGESLDKYLAN